MERTLRAPARTRRTSVLSVIGDDHRTVSFGAGWRFGAYTDGSEQPGFDDSALAPVTLPHTVAPLSWQDWDPASWERVVGLPQALRRTAWSSRSAGVPGLRRGHDPRHGDPERDPGRRPPRRLPAVQRGDQRAAAAGRERAGGPAGRGLQPQRAAGPAGAGARHIGGLLAAGRPVPRRAAADSAAGLPGRRLRQARQVLDPAARQVVVQATIDAAAVPARRTSRSNCSTTAG